MPPTTSTTDFKHETQKIEHENYLDVKEGRSLLSDSSSIVNPGSYFGKDDHATSTWIKILCVSNLLSRGIVFLIAWKLFTTSCVNP
jgi:hypothetical protein